ncbi:MAG: substrate-binding domain-containing protein [Pirellulales bacterium]
MSGGVPTVNTTGDWFEPRIPTITVDSDRLAEIAGNALKVVGCRSYLFFGYAPSTASRMRADAFVGVMEKLGGAATRYQCETLYRGSFEDDDKVRTDRVLLKLLKAALKPLGVWAHTDAYGTAAIKACLELGLDIPSEVKILGTNDTGLCRTSTPTLSSIHTPLLEIGYRAVQFLTRMLAGEKIRKLTTLRQIELFERATTGTSAASGGDIEAVREHIQRHACAGVSVEELLRVAHCSRRTLQTRFVERYGHGPYEEVQNVRLARACELLRETRLSISRIAAMVGFQEVGAFGKFFRKQTQRSPKAYRQQMST